MHFGTKAYLDLQLVEITHVVYTNHLVAVNVDAPEPVAQARLVSLILLRQHEIHKVLILKPVGVRVRIAPLHLRPVPCLEYAVDYRAVKTVLAVSR